MIVYLLFKVSLKHSFPYVSHNGASGNLEQVVRKECKILNITFQLGTKARIGSYL